MSEEDGVVTRDYMGVIEWATEAGFTVGRVRNWMNAHEPPTPDITINGQYRGWDRSRMAELVAWCHEREAALDLRAVNTRFGFHRGRSG